MRFHTTLLVSFGILVGGCSSYSESTYNPMNWYGSEEIVDPSLAPEEGYLVLTDIRELIPEVTSLQVSNTNGGVIVHATGVPETQGYHTADLVSVSDEEPVDGVLAYEFRVLPPYEVSPVGSVRSREITAAHFISNAKLRNAREIKVIAATNSRSSRAQ